MRRVILLVAVTLASVLHAEAAETGCGSFALRVDGRSLDLAPPRGFVEICRQDAELCRTLTAGYPPSVLTLGYFVSPEEWKRFKSGPPIGFTRYLIAQSTSSAPGDLPDLKNHIRSRQGAIHDHTALPNVLQSEGRANIGVFEDTDDAIAFGTIMKLRPRPPAPDKDLVLAATNTAFIAREKLLSLYVFLDVTATNEVEAVKRLTREWLGCLRATNKR